ncbi:MAG: hypothetical protein GBAus27B_000043 [Mycoplasmataceae bacterium]|nr:MAG: hypothetical protein GBAus27B_000043 [Mycoplasmataceae bacterium]
MSINYIKCTKCGNNAEIDSNIYRNEYAASYPIRDKDGQIYCWDCYKGKSHCKSCQKSVANLKFPLSGQSQYPHCNGGVSYNCEKKVIEVEFICSRKCSEKLANQKYQTWKEKLNQGWIKCEQCVKEWVDGWSNKKWWEWLKEEKQYSRFIKLLPLGEERICYICKPYEKNGYYHKIHQQAQQRWNSLSYEEKLAEVIKTDRVGMAKFYGRILTSEELAKQEKVPRSIYEEFVHS